MARIAEIVIDSLQPAGLARFWAQALDDYAVRTYDEPEIRRLQQRYEHRERLSGAGECSTDS